MLDFAGAARLVQARIAGFHKIPVVTRDILDPLTGDLDGAEIHIDYAVTEELRLFLLAHLLGHTVQWNVDPRAYEIGQLQPPPISESALAPILDYEAQAARYSLSMLHAAGVTEFDQWLSDFSAGDIAYLTHYYRTGEKLDFEVFRVNGAPLLQPLAIPEFTPRRMHFRVDGIVI